MKTEYEIRFLDIDEKGLIEKLENLGATFVGDWFQIRYVYDFETPRAGKQSWMRLRTNGAETTLTIKEQFDDTIAGTQEHEIVVSDFDETAAILEKLGFKPHGIQENRRKRYILDGVEIDIDTWPLIPTYVEFEGADEAQIKNVCEKLGFQYSAGYTMGVRDIVMQIYKIPKEELDYVHF